MTCSKNGIKKVPEHQLPEKGGRTITGKEAFELLREADAYIIMDNNQAIVYGEPEENEVNITDENGNRGISFDYKLFIGYEDDGVEYGYTFSWSAEDQIRVENNQIFLPKSSGEETGIKVLSIKEL